MTAAYQTFFGDAEYSFRLTAPMIKELETKCGAIGALCARVFNRQFGQADISETIRLALIGNGETTPKRAAELIAAYVADRPLIETLPLATKILERLYFGAPNEAPNGQA